MGKGSYQGGSTIIRVGDLARRAPQLEPVPAERIREIEGQRLERAARQLERNRQYTKLRDRARAAVAEMGDDEGEDPNAII